MMPITRSDLKILLDSPDRTDYIVSAFADLTVKDGFRHFAQTELGNIARRAGAALSEAEASKALDEHLGPILEAVEKAEPRAKGLAAFSAPGRGLFHVAHLAFPMPNRVVIDEEPYVLPLLERWYGEPSYLIALVDSHALHLFEAHAGETEHVGGFDKVEPAEIQRDKPRFTYKRRFKDAFHERQQELLNDEWLKGVAGTVSDHYRSGSFTGLILLGQAPTTAAVRKLLHKEAASAVVLENAQTMRAEPRADDVEDDVREAVESWKQAERERLLGELEQRWSRNYLVANGPTEVLDALQQGRAVEVVFGPDRIMPGARCSGCGYRFGAPVATCVYCGGRTSTVDAAQEIMRMAVGQEIASVHLLDRIDRQNPDPLARANGVAALLRAEANWAPAGGGEGQ